MKPTLHRVPTGPRGSAPTLNDVRAFAEKLRAAEPHLHREYPSLVAAADQASASEAATVRAIQRQMGGDDPADRPLGPMDHYVEPASTRSW